MWCLISKKYFLGKQIPWLLLLILRPVRLKQRSRILNKGSMRFWINPHDDQRFGGEEYDNDLALLHSMISSTILHKASFRVFLFNGTLSIVHVGRGKLCFRN